MKLIYMITFIFFSLFSKQAAHLLEAPKSVPDDIASISSTCFKLNSLQLRALLQNYISGPGEPRIPPDLIDRLVTARPIGPCYLKLIAHKGYCI